MNGDKNNNRDRNQDKNINQNGDVNLNKKEAEKLLKTYEDIKHIGSDYSNKLKNSQIIIWLGNNIDSYMINPTKKAINTHIPNIINKILNLTIIRVPRTLVNDSQCKNDLVFTYGNGKELRVTYVKRKFFVLSSTLLLGLSYTLIRKKFALRYFIFAYLSFSLFLCRENLNPYI
jgi:hypothetical protein